MANYVRRLPIYLMLDCSGSMSGEPIEAVRQGVKALLSELRGVPQALETAHLSVITFNSSAQQVSPLTELMLFKEPELVASGGTSMGWALEVLMDCAKNEVKKTTEEQKGDYKPLVFLLTDGEPTDTSRFKEAVKRIPDSLRNNIIACAAGASANTARLKEITPNVLMMNSLSAGDMAQFFAWVSASATVQSKSVSANPDQPVQLPPPPQGFVIVP